MKRAGVRWFYRTVFLNTNLSGVVMTAIGLCATVTATMSPLTAVIICTIIGVIAATTVAAHVKHACEQFSEERQRLNAAADMFLRLPDDWKRAIKQIHVDGCVKQDFVEDYNSFADCPFVALASGRFYLANHFARFVPAILKQWEAMPK